MGTSRYFLAAKINSVVVVTFSHMKKEQVGFPLQLF